MLHNIADVHVNVEMTRKQTTTGTGTGTETPAVLPCRSLAVCCGTAAAQLLSKSRWQLECSEGGMIRLETLIELKLFNSSFLV